MATLVISDFDRTLFRSDEHTLAVLEIASKKLNLSGEETHQLRDELLEGQDSVDIAKLLKRRGVVLADILAELAGHGETYLYDDATDFMARCDNYWIVTTAINMNEQMAKLKLAGLADISTILQRQKKGGYILSKLVAGESGWSFLDYDPMQQEFETIIVVDDRLDAVEALIGIEGVRIYILQRPDAKYTLNTEDRTGIKVITSLKDIQL